MSEDDMFRLHLNDFEKTISTTWQTLRNEKDLCDVTLACDDNQIQSHKIILSSCSPIFKKMLTQNKHNHPLLYLRGVSFSELVNLLDFMYLGEVNIANTDLNSFLALAQDLKVQGLTTDQGVEQILNNSGPQVQIKCPEEEGSPPKNKKRKYNKCHEPNTKDPSSSEKPSKSKNDGRELEMLPLEMESSCLNDHMLTLSSTTMPFNEENILNGIESEYGIEELKQERKRTLDTVHDGNLLQFLCEHCEYKSPRRNNLTQHMESVHEGVRYPCDYCDYKATKKHYLKTHIRKKHVEYLTLF